MPHTMTVNNEDKKLDLETLKKILSHPKLESEAEQGQKSEALTDKGQLAERYMKQQNFISFMIGARCLWENLVGGATQSHKKKRDQTESQVPKVNENEIKAKQKLKPDVRKALYAKLK